MDNDRDYLPQEGSLNIFLWLLVILIIIFLVLSYLYLKKPQNVYYLGVERFTDNIIEYLENKSVNFNLNIKSKDYTDNINVAMYVNNNYVYVSSDYIYDEPLKHNYIIKDSIELNNVNTLIKKLEKELITTINNGIYSNDIVTMNYNSNVYRFNRNSLIINADIIDDFANSVKSNSELMDLLVEITGYKKYDINEYINRKQKGLSIDGNVEFIIYTRGIDNRFSGIEIVKDGTSIFKIISLNENIVESKFKENDLKIENNGDILVEFSNDTGIFSFKMDNKVVDNNNSIVYILYDDIDENNKKDIIEKIDSIIDKVTN